MNRRARIVYLTSNAAISEESRAPGRAEHRHTLSAEPPPLRVGQQQTTTTWSTGNRAEHVLNGAVTIVAIRSRDDGKSGGHDATDRAGDGREPATKARPSPVVAITPSIKNAALDI